MLLPRPFKITKIGPVRLFVEDVDRAEAFYTRHLGLTKSEESFYRGARCVFLRTGAEHHSVALYPRELRGVLGLSPHTTCLSFGVELANYAQLRAAVAFLKAQGCTLVDLPPELYPGIDYAAFARDPDGHCIQLYYYMEQIGWDGRVRPGLRAPQRRGRMARGAGAAQRYLRGPGVPGAVRLTRASRAWAGQGAGHHHARAQPSRRGSEPASSMPVSASRRMISTLHGPSRSPTVSTG